MQRRIFLDYASTTPLDTRVFKAMLPFMARDFGNPSALYKEGVTTKNAIKDARTSVARILNVKPEEITFTASGTESDNMALSGVVQAWRQHFSQSGQVPHIITTNIEHPGILEVCKQLEKWGIEVTYVPVEESGIVDPQKIKKALKPTTVLVSVMYANNEIGTIQPIREISRVIKEYQKAAREMIVDGVGRGLARNNHFLSTPYLHTDASQAANYLDLSFQKLGVDMMTLDSSKFYGPKGVGVLALKRHVSIQPLIRGGGQERGLRSGTENVPGIVGFARALELAVKIQEKEVKRLKTLQDYFTKNVIKMSPRVSINGDLETRLPHNVNICIDGIDSEFAVIKLDTAGISCSAASSCLNLSEEPYSYVIDALGKRGNACKNSSLRFTFGRGTKKKDLDLTLARIKAILITQ